MSNTARTTGTSRPARPSSSILKFFLVATIGIVPSAAVSFASGQTGESQAAKAPEQQAKPKTRKGPVAVSQSTLGRKRIFSWQTSQPGGQASRVIRLGGGSQVNPDLTKGSIERQQMTGIIPKIQQFVPLTSQSKLGNGWSRGRNLNQLQSLPGAIGWRTSGGVDLLGRKPAGNQHSAQTQNLPVQQRSGLVQTADFRSGQRNGNPVQAKSPANKNQVVDLEKIWLKDASGEWSEAAHFRKSINMESALAGWMTVDANCSYQVYCNGYLAGTHSYQPNGSKLNKKYDISRFLRRGKNLVAVYAKRVVADDPGIGIKIEYQTSTTKQTVDANRTWLASKSALPLWKTNLYNDRNWQDAEIVPQEKTAQSPVRIAKMPIEKLSPKISVSAAPKTSTVNEIQDRKLASSKSDKKPTTKPTAAVNTTGVKIVQAADEKAKLATKKAEPTLPGKTPRPLPSSKNIARAATKDLTKPGSVVPVSFSQAKLVQGSKQSGDQKKEINLRVLPQFVVEPVADAGSGSLIAMTFDELGRIVASREKGGLIRIDMSKPVGDKGRIHTIHPTIMAVQGILPLNGSLYVTGITKQGMGLYALSDKDGDQHYETVKKICGFAGKPGEHGPHAIHLGADRMLYVLLGNHCKLEDEKAASNYRYYEGNILPKQEDPGGHAVGVKAPGGTIVRLSLDGKYKEIFAGGIRNAYDFGINSVGEVFVHDSDMESDVGASWYRPTSLYHVTAGSDLGWRSGSAKWPTHYPDSVSPMARTGRGSPSGAVVYDHVRFPKEYRGAMFLGDWSAGRIMCAKLTPDGAGYTTKISTFMEGTPLNVTDLAIGPKDGALYVCLGGRDSSGGVYRVRWAGPEDKRLVTYASIWEEIIRTPMFFSAPTRQRLAELRVKAGKQWDQAIRSIATSQKNVDAYRIRAINIMQWYGPVPTSEMLTTFSEDKSAAIRRTAASIMGSRSDQALATPLVKLLSDSDPVVKRIAAESLTRRIDTVAIDKVIPLLSYPDERVQLAGRRLLETIPADLWAAKVAGAGDQETFVHGAISLLNVQPNLKNAYDVLVGVSERIAKLDKATDHKRLLDLLRVTQLAVIAGDVQGDKIPAFNEKLVAMFPHKNPEIQRELANLLIRLKVTGLDKKYISLLKEPNNLTKAKFHLAFHLATVADQISDECRMACLEVLERVSVDEKGGGSFPFYAGTSATKIAQNLTESGRGQVLAGADSYPNAAIVCLRGLGEELDEKTIDQLIQVDQKLATRFDAASRKLKMGIVAKLATNVYRNQKAANWLVELFKRDPSRREVLALAMAVQLNKPLPKQSVAPLTQPAVSSTKATVATIKFSSEPSAKKLSGPTVENKKKLQQAFFAPIVKCLPALTTNSVNDVLSAIADCDNRSLDPEDYRQLILIGLRFPKTANVCCQILSKWAGKIGLPKDRANQIGQWQAWYSIHYKDHLPATLPSADDAGKWKLDSLLNQIQKMDKDAARGRIVYKKALCADCHQAGGLGVTVGPDLTSLTSRFTEREILESILHPSQVIPERYRGQVVLTEDGKVYTGLVSESENSTLTIIDNSGQRRTLQKIDVAEVKPSKVSVMPNRLLEDLNAQQVADLMEFLRQPNVEKK